MPSGAGTSQAELIAAAPVQERDPELRLPKISSLVIILLTNVLLQISFFIIVSTSNEYAQHLGGDSTFSGIVIGIPTVFSGLALLPLMKFDKGGYKLPLHVACGSSILGLVLYASAYRANYLYLILIGRIVNGFAFSMWMYTKRYCSDARIVGVRRRTTLASWLVIGQGVGMTLGPFAGGLLYKIGFNNSVFNGFTAPGWILAGVWGVFWLAVVKWYEDPPASPAGAQSAPTPADGDSNVSLLQKGGVIACMCWFAMTCFFVLGAWESNLPVFGAAAAELGWSPFAAGNFIALGGLCTFPFLILNLLFARRMQDRHILAWGTAVGFSGLIIFLSLLYGKRVNYGSAFVCWFVIALGFNVASTVTTSLLSKRLPSMDNGKASLAIQYSNYTGRVTGAVWGGSGVTVGMTGYVGLEIALVGVGALLSMAFWKDLKAKTG